MKKILFILGVCNVLFATTYYVNVNNFGATAPYTNWATAAVTIQDALDIAGSDDTVIVTNGVYSVGGAATPGNLLYCRVMVNNKITIKSVNGPSETIILGQGPIGAGAVRCAYLVKDAMLIGFTLSNGHTRATDDSDYDRSGGGVIIEGNGMLTNCVVRNCVADYHGGGVLLKGGGSVCDSLIIRNVSEWDGGGVSCNAGGEVIQSTVIGNVATNMGGGIHYNVKGTVKKCVVTENAADHGGGIYCNGSGLIDNSLFVKNEAWHDGGGVFLNNYVSVRNTTICNNKAVQDGGGIYCRINGTNLNTLIYFNNAGRHGDNHMEFGSRLYYSYCCTTPAVSNLYDGGGNITADPQVYDEEAGDYGLSSTSPCIGAGNNLYAPDDYDIDGRQRILGTPQIVDIGCFEHVPQDAGVGDDHYVSAGGGNFWPYDTTQKAAINIQDAIDAAADTDRIIVNDGVYERAYRGVKGIKNRIAIVNKSITILANKETPSDVIVLGRKDLLADGLGSNAVRCVYLKGNKALLGNFVFSNGYTRLNNAITFSDIYQGFGGAVLIDYYGVISNCILSSSKAVAAGGVYCSGGGSVIDSHIINNSVIEAGGGGLINAAGLISNTCISGNSSSVSGGAVYLMDNTILMFACNADKNNAPVNYSGGLIDSCEILRNSADAYGGAVYFLKSGYVKDSQISYNLSSAKGGALFMSGGGRVERCKIVKNNVTGDGGGAYFFEGGEIINSLFCENFGIYGGGAFFSSGGKIESCTIVSNSCAYGGGGVYCDDGGTNINNIIYVNRTIGGGSTNYQHNGSGMYYTFCCTYPEIAGAPNGAGNITNAPIFSDTVAYDFHLLSGSPCIDEGTNMAWMADAKDLDGNPRIYDGTVDMGCYEDVPEPYYLSFIIYYLILIIRKLNL